MAGHPWLARIWTQKYECLTSRLTKRLTVTDSETIFFGLYSSRQERGSYELAENYEEVSARPNFFDSYKAKKRAYDQLMEAWELAEEKVANFS